MRWVGRIAVVLREVMLATEITDDFGDKLARFLPDDGTAVGGVELNWSLPMHATCPWYLSSTPDLDAL